MALNLQFRFAKPGPCITLKNKARERLNDAIKAYEDAERYLLCKQPTYMRYRKQHCIVRDFKIDSNT